MFDFVVDRATESDLPVVMDSWQKCFLGQSRSFPRGRGALSEMVRGDYFKGQGAVIQGCLAHGDLHVARWVDVEDGSIGQVIGWLCGAPAQRVLHFIYVWEAYRQEGVGSGLMNACFDEVGVEPIALTHWTRVTQFYKKRWKLNYNPYLLFEVM
jgi:GNAT superfamily N-acetyltransferase